MKDIIAALEAKRAAARAGGGEKRHAAQHEAGHRQQHRERAEQPGAAGRQMPHRQFGERPQRRKASVRASIRVRFDRSAWYLSAR